MKKKMIMLIIIIIIIIVTFMVSLKHINLPNYQEINYGLSENGRELICYEMAPRKYNKTLYRTV